MMSAPRNLMKPVSPNSVRRMWINQPSTFDTLHRLHGKNVLVMAESEETARIYFLEGPVESQQAPWMSLSDGWRSGLLRTRRPVMDEQDAWGRGWEACEERINGHESPQAGKELERVALHESSDPTWVRGFIAGYTDAAEALGWYDDEHGRYAVRRLMEIAEGKPTIEIETRCLRHTEPDEPFGSPEFVVRAEKVDTQYPIFVLVEENGAYQVIDGMHRLWRAMKECRKIEAILFTREDMAYALEPEKNDL